MALNPVERCLVDLAGRWQVFRDDTSKRLLIWQVADNAFRLLQCFFEVQKHDTEYSTADLFIVFDAPFDNSIQYARSLKEALAGQYDASREDLIQQGVEPAWQYAPESFPDTATGFVRSVLSMLTAHRTTLNGLAIVLMPQHVADDEAFVAWLRRALDSGMPDQLRIVVPESTESPRLSALIAARHLQVAIDAPPIDGLATAQQTFAQEATVGPAGVFRNHLIGLAALAEKGSADQVNTKAQDAIAFARQQQWPDQEAVVLMLVAGAFLKEKRFGEATQSYRNARQAATQADAGGHPAAQQLILQTWFGEAGAYLAAGDDLQAADCYDEAGRVAQQISNAILAIEAFRMGAFCYARLDDRDAALERSDIALILGGRLEPDERQMTTLPIAAVDVLRVVEPKRVKRMEALKQRQEAQIGAARASAEQRIAVLEHNGDAQRLRVIEDRLAHETAQARQEAAQSLNKLVGAGNEQFRALFARARDLLGEQWPLLDPMAMPQAAQERGA